MEQVARERFRKSGVYQEIQAFGALANQDPAAKASARQPIFRVILWYRHTSSTQPVEQTVIMNKTIKAIISWAIVLWICRVFLASLPYKFTRHPDTRHIFDTIGEWLGGVLGAPIGEWFAAWGAYAVGSFELLTSVVLLLPAACWALALVGVGSSAGVRARLHSIGGLMAAAVMSGAVFFHLFTPLGVEVLHQGKSDGGSLFYAAVSILVLGVVLFFLNAKRGR